MRITGRRAILASLRTLLLCPAVALSSAYGSPTAKAGRRASVPVLIALLLASRLWGFTETTVAVDGAFSDWVMVLSDDGNTITDPAKGAGDLDSPAQTSSDLRNIAVTWDATNLYFYFRRGTQSNSGISCVIYLDANHNGLMETNEPVLFFNFNNSGFQGFALYRYSASVGGGDSLGGDGASPPGTIGSALSTAGSGAQDAAGVQYEGSVAWAVLAPYGVTARSPLWLHPTLALGTNLPSQIEDNGKLLNTLVQAITLTPDNDSTTKPGEIVSFPHSVNNGGNGVETAELGAVSQQGWAVTFWNSTGTALLMDTNGNGTVDTGPIPAHGSVNIVVKVVVPSSAPTQTNDTETVSATAASNSTVKGSALDSIYAGFVVTFHKNQEQTGTPGITVPYTQQFVQNLTAAAITIAVSAVSSRGWVVQVENDTNCDDTPETGPITQFTLDGGASTCLITAVAIPSGTPWGTTDVTTTTISFGNPAILIPVTSTTHVDDLFTVAPNNSGSEGAGQTIFYAHTIRNNQSTPDLFNIQATSSLTWGVALFAADGITPLGDHNADGIPDTGPLASFGGKFTFRVRITILAGATYNQQDVTTVRATSAGLPSQSRTAADTTTVKLLVTFKDASFTTPSAVFTGCSTVFYQAFGLSGGTYRFVVLDPSGTPKNGASPAQMSPDQSGQVSDSYKLLASDTTGAWSVKLQQKSGSTWTDLTYYLAAFTVANTGSLALSTGRPVYKLTGETLTVSSTASNPNAAPFEGGTLGYVVFVDASGNGQPDAGETYLKSDGTTAAYALGGATHLTTPLDVPSLGSKTDAWSIAVADFGTQGTWKVRAVWQNGCASTVATALASFQVILDGTPPVSSITWPSNGATLYLSTAPFTVAGTASDVGTYVAAVQVSADGGFTWAGATNTGTNFSTWNYPWAPFYRGAYTLKSKAMDAVGNVEVPGAGASVTVVDDTPPTTPVVADNGVYTALTVSASWSSQDPNSGISGYRYCIGTSAGSCDVTAWLAVGMATGASRSDIVLTHGATYTFNVISTNLDGYDSSSGSSNGITCDLQGPATAVTDPVAGQVLSGSIHTVLGTASDALSGVASVEVSADGGSTWNPAAGTTAWSYVWTLPADGNYILYARSRDGVGNMGPISTAVPVKVDNPPAPPSNLTARPDGDCVVTLAWSPSPSPDIDHYSIYHNGGTGPVDYSTPVASVPAAAKIWKSSRGVYGWCGQDIALDSESGWTENSIAAYRIINANRENFTITGATVGWTNGVPARFLSEVEIGGVTVFSRPPGTPDNNGGSFAFFPSTPMTPGQTVEVRFHFEFVAGGYPEMTGDSINVAFSGGPGPRIASLLLTPGRTPEPCRDDNLQSLIVGADYTFGIRAFDLGGAQDGNTTVTVGSPACAPSLSAALFSPKAGEKVKGQEVTVYAEIAFGNLWDVQRVLFQYRTSPAGSWVDLPGTLEHPNPDAAWPYFTYWDASALPIGPYDLRAVVRHVLGYDDPMPPFVTVSVVSSAPNLIEERAAGLHYAQEDVRVVSSGNRVVAGDDQHDNVSQVWIPAGALAADTQCRLTISADPGTVPPQWGTGLEFRDIALTSGQVNLSGGAMATMEIPYNDADNDGIVDGTTTPEWNLALYYWDGGAWSASGISSSQVNLVTNVVRASSSHFTLFAPLTEPPAADSVPPREVTQLKLSRSLQDLRFTWDPVTLDVNGGPEIIHHYNIYRGTVPSFIPDMVGHVNLIGAASGLSFDQAGGIDAQPAYYYLATAVDRGYNEGAFAP